MWSSVGTARLQSYEAGLRQSAHAHDTTSVTLLIKGRLRETVSNTEEAAGSLSLVVKPAGVVHADLFGPERVVTCQIVLDASEQESGPWGRALSRWRWVHGGPPVRAALALVRVLRRHPAEIDARREAAIAVLDTLANAPCAASAPAWLPRAVEFLGDQIDTGADRVRVTDVACVAGVHPVHLARVFRAQYGCTVSAWVRRLRVQRAARRLEEKGAARLSGVALEAGFADQSHMNRSFRQEMALLPREYRELAASL